MSWLSSRELKIYLLVVGSITVLALLIVLIVLLPGYISYNKSITQSNLIPDNKIDMSKFIIPESYKKLWDNSWAHFWVDKEQWSLSDVEPYWNDPKTIILQYLEEQNEKLVNDIFKDIP